MSNYVIETNQLVKQFGDLTAVNQVSLQLEAGKIYGFIGPNGAGKTTTMSLLIGLIYPTSGNGTINGHPIGSIEAKRLIGYAPEFPSFYTDMSCLEYLIYMGQLSGLSGKEAYKKTLKLLGFLNLLDHKDKKVARFSTGMKKKVGFANALMHDPEIILLDEPTANLDPTSRLEIIDLIKKLVEENNTTVLVSSHVLAELELIVSDVIMIKQGKIIISDSMEEVQNQFSNSTIVLNTNNNDLFKEKLKEIDIVTKIDIEKNDLMISTSDIEQLKMFIIDIAYQNRIGIHKLVDDNVSLDDVYRDIVTKESDS